MNYSTVALNKLLLLAFLREIFFCFVNAGHIYGNYSIIHDQLGLVKKALSTEEVLLRRRELESQFFYYTSLGCSYTFGSIYNNMVNPRFGDHCKSEKVRYCKITC